MPAPAPRTRTPRPKPVRTMYFNKLAGVLYLHVHRSGEAEVGYFVDEVRCDLGGRAFTLTKILDRSTYHVRIGPGSEVSCECKGFLRHRTPCKHIDALSHLITAGSL